ncbi:MAG: RNA polymerase factor sigma-54 [Candidatus Latescibacteria bacterium]|nr:RNA polymerase factor sigma-54 [Candidatus Latescibacterota bacterium]
MELGLRTQLSQTISPQLIQSLKLLQIPLLELEQVMKQELQTNPMLEEEDETTEPDELEQSADSVESPVETNGQVDSAELGLKSTSNEIDWDAYLRDGVAYEYEHHEQTERDEDRNLLDREGKTGTTLANHLISQLHLLSLSVYETEIGEYIIGNLGEDGYLTCPVEEIAEKLGTDPATVEQILTVVQTLEPVGVGARNLRECLLIQFRADDQEDTLAARIIHDHLDDLQNRRYAVIKKALKVSQEAIQDALQQIAELNPKPGLSIGSETAIPIIPDLIVEKVDGEYVVMLNDRNLPRLRINGTYLTILNRSSHASDDARQYVRQKLNDARWLVHSIEQRRTTMLKVMNYIVKAQRGFFDKGLPSLKPMVLQEVADAINMHPATVSRVTASKYVQTARGVFPLKFFFDGMIETEDGEELSTKSVKDRIARLIKEEDPHDPLSDQKIVDVLHAQGVDIARRTIAKYRDQLGIMPARYRKKV